MGLAISSTGGGVAGDDDVARDSSPVVRRVALAAIVLVGWLFGYSIGWQKGWIVGNSGTDERFQRFNQTLRDLHLGPVGSAGTADACDESADSA